MAIRWGIAVIGMKIAIAAPITEPMVTPTKIHWNWTISLRSSVPTMASNMPTSASISPRRAVSGELNPLRPKMKRTAAGR